MGSLEVRGARRAERQAGRARIRVTQELSDAVEGHLYEELTLREIAGRTGVAVSTVDWRLRLGLEGVRATLERDADGRDVRRALVALAGRGEVTLLEGIAVALLGAAAAFLVAASLARGHVQPSARRAMSGVPGRDLAVAAGPDSVDAGRRRLRPVLTRR